LTEIIPLAQSTIYQHLKALKEIGIIQGEIITPKINYCLNKANWAEAQQLAETLFNSQKTMKLSMRKTSHNGMIIVARFHPEKPGQVMTVKNQKINR
jgi:predicted transcriptional regulator